jgi:AAA family ATP:ADP antiporter
MRDIARRRNRARAQSKRVDARVRTQGYLSLWVTLWGAAAFAALLASYTAFRPVRDALILDSNPDQLPWVFVGTFVAVSVLSPVWSAMLARWPRRRVIPLAYHVFALCAFGFFLLKRADVSPLMVGRVFYVWSGVFNFFVVSVLWSLFADLLGPGTARRLYGPIAAGGTVGTFVGPLLTKALVGTIGVPGVLLMSAVLLEVALVCIYQVRRTGAKLAREDAARGEREMAGEADADAPVGGGAFTGIARVIRTPYLAAIVGYVLCTAFLATFLYFRQADIVREAITSRNARTEYFATIDLWVAGVTLVFQTLIARPALGWFGPGVVLCVLPIVQLVGLSVVVAAPSLATLAVVQVLGRSATHGLTRPSRELLFTVVSRDDKYRAKNAIDTIGYRLGDMLSGWLNTGLIALAGLAAVVGAAIPIVAVWLGLAVILGVGFRRRAAQEVPSS